MKTLEISDELYEELKTYVVDPFEDTAEIVISRLLQIADKAKQKWAPFEIPARANIPPEPVMTQRTRISYEEPQNPGQSQEVIL